MYFSMNKKQKKIYNRHYNAWLYNKKTRKQFRDGITLSKDRERHTVATVQIDSAKASSTVAKDAFTLLQNSIFVSTKKKELYRNKCQYLN